MATTITPESLQVEDPLKTITPTKDMTNDQSILDTQAASTKTALDTIKTYSEALKSKTADTQALNESSGVNSATADINKYTADLAQINANISGLANEAKAIPLQVQEANKNTGATDAGVAPQTTGKLRENAIKALTQSSLADVLTANITGSQIKLAAAKDKVQQAIDLKYKPMEDEIANLKEQLQLNKDYITDPAEKRLLSAQERILNERNRILTEKKTNEQNVANIALEAAKNGASPDVVAKINAAPNAAAAIEAAGSALQTKDTQITTLGDGSTVLVDKKTGKILKTISGGSNGNVTLPSTVVRTVNTGTGATPVTGYTLQKGDDPYQVAINNGISLDTLKSLNPDVKDWTKLPAGYVLNLPSAQDSWLKGKTPEQVAAYNSLPEADKASVKQLVNGDALLADIVKGRGKTTQKDIQDLVNKATAIDPNFSINQNKQRYQYQTQFNNPNGKEQLQINAFNTALGHMGTTYESAVALGNVKLPLYNNIKNWVSKNSGNPALTNFQYDLTILASEIASAYKGGTAPTDQETEKIYNSIASNFSPSQFKGVLDQSTKLMASKIDALSTGYKNVMGSYPENSLVSPTVLDELVNAGVDVTPIIGKMEAQGYAVPENAKVSQNSPTSFMGINLPQTKPTSFGTSPFANGGLFAGFQLPH